jgi:hypothetical protein
LEKMAKSFARLSENCQKILRCSALLLANVCLALQEISSP